MTLLPGAFLIYQTYTRITTENGGWHNLFKPI
jgi:hypothetical protein